ncbi:hypothetical protein V2A60_004030 [Cordyceps javanica]
MRLPTPNYLPASIYSEGNSFSAAVTTPRSAFTLKPTIMAETQETMSTDDVKGLIGHLLEKIPEDQRVPFLQSQLGHYGIRELSSEPSDFATRRQRGRRAKKPPRNSQSSVSRDSASPRSISGAEPSKDKDKESHQCGFCKEMDHVVACARKNDLKRHMGDFHHIVTEYRCPVPGCTFWTESKKLFAQHIKIDGRHKQVISNNEMTQHEIVIFEPIIFACGFANCSLLWEAPPTGDDGKTFRDYIEHVIKHYDDDKCAEWSYETRMQNLLRQSRMQGLLQNVDMTGLKWDWKCSTTLRRELMTGNIANKNEIMQRAFRLGSGNLERDDMEQRPLLALQDRACPRAQSLGRRRQRMQKNQRGVKMPNQYNYDSSYQLHAPCPEPVAAPDMGMRRSADPSPSPAAYSGSIHAAAQTPLGDGMTQLYARASQEVFMGAEASQLDPRMYPAVPAQHGYTGQRDMPSFLIDNGYVMETETPFLTQGMSHH